jgi:hypothetical protein
MVNVVLFHKDCNLLQVQIMIILNNHFLCFLVNVDVLCGMAGAFIGRPSRPSLVQSSNRSSPLSILNFFVSP